jgi:hypothetical protein
MFVHELKRVGGKGRGRVDRTEVRTEEKERRGRKGEGKRIEIEKGKRGCQPKWRKREKKRKEKKEEGIR